MTKDGYRFIQVLLPVKTHKNLAEKSKRLGQSNAETVRNAIESFLGVMQGKTSQAQVREG